MTDLHGGYEMNSAGQKQAIIEIIRDWRNRGVQGTVLFSSHLLLRYWEEQLLTALGWLGGINLSLFGGLVETLTRYQSLGRGLSSAEQVFLLWGIARDRMRQMAESGAPDKLAQAGMARAVARLFREFKQAEVTPKVLEEAGIKTAPGIKGIYREYHSVLTKLGKVDPEDAFREALRILQSRGIPEQLQRVLVVGFQEFTGIQRELLAFLKGRGEVVILEEPLLTTALSSRGNSEVLLDLLAENTGVVRGFTGSDREWEVRGLAREIRQRLAVGRSPSDIAVVCRNTDTYLPIILQVFSEYEIPVEREPMPAWTSLPKLAGYFLYLKAVAANGAWGEITRLFTQYFTGDYGRIFDGWLREDFYTAGIWPLTLTAWVEWLEKRSLTADPMLAEAMMGLAHLLAMEPPATLGDFWRLGHAFFSLPDLNVPDRDPKSPWFLKKLRIRRMQAEAETAWERWANLTKLAGWQGLPLTIEEFLPLIELLFADYRAPEYRRPGAGVVITHPAELKGLRFPVVFLCGLVEGEFPRTPSRSGLLDQESLNRLRQLGYSLKGPEEFLRGERENFYQLVKAAGEELILSCPLGDADGRPQAVSVFLREVREALGKPTWPHYSPVYRFRLPPISSRELKFNKALHNPAFLEQGLVEQNRRRGEARYVGLIGESREIRERLAQHFSPDYPFSITALEGYARCPFAFYCQKVLGVEPLKTPALMAEPLELGTVSHEILRVFLGDYAGIALNREQRESYLRRLDELLDEEFPLPETAEDELGQIVLRRLQRESLRRMLRYFVDDELDWQSRINGSYLPGYFELEFGSAREKGLVLGEGKAQVRLIGKIDRLDFRTDGKAFIIFDYKINQVPTRSQLEKGLDLQLPLYLLAAETIFTGSESKGGGYYSLLKRERTKGLWRKSWSEETGVRVYKPVEDVDWREKLGLTVDFILKYAAAIRNGDFRLTSDECRRGCDYRPVCRRLHSGGMTDEDE